MSFITSLFGQHMQDSTQNNSTAANAQDAFNKNLTDLYNTVNTDKTNLFNAETSNLTAKNDIATKNPSTFAKQIALADILGNTPTFNSKGGSAVNYNGLSDAGKQGMSALIQEATNNLLNSPKDNPVPQGANTAMAPTLASAPTIKGFQFDNYANPGTYTPTPVQSGNTDPNQAIPKGSF